MKCVSHRGYTYTGHTENSIGAIQEAINRSYDGIEFDVQLCGSGEIVVHHDLYLGSDFIYNLSLKELNEKGVCSLQQLYEQVPDIKDIFTIVDIKGSNTKIIEELVKFYKNRSTKNVYFSSFNRNIVYNLPYNFLKGTAFETTFIQNEYDMITRNLSIVVLHWTSLDHNFISYCNMKDIKVYTYTHKGDKELEYMYKYNVDGIITNGF